MIVGIDGGLSGGIVALNNNGTFFNYWFMPTIKSSTVVFDCCTLSMVFKAIKKHCNKNEEQFIVYLEQAHPRPVSGKRANFMTGYGFGLLEGILSTLDISYEIISPSAWMKELKLKKTEESIKPSIIWTIKKFPDVVWKKTEKCKNYADGLTDACCIAYYGYLQNNRK